MSQQSSGEKTEQPSRKKLEKAKKQGQVPRSKDLTSGLLLICAMALLLLNGRELMAEMGTLFSDNWLLTPEDLQQQDLMARHLAQSLKNMLLILSQTLFWLWLATALAAMLPKGPLFYPSLLAPKFSKLNPIKGLAKIGGKQSWVELGKSILKVTVFVGIALLYLKGIAADLPQLLGLTPYQAIFAALGDVLLGVLLLAFGALAIGALDLPYQLWKTNNDLKMTKQEVKDEHKQQEGKPEVKAKIRQIQQQMARARTTTALPQADVLLVNPEHYAVALKFDEQRAEAPFVLTKGVDELALYMKTLAPSLNLEVVEAPTLTRAIYFSTRIEQQIPPTLYRAVAQVLRYVAQLQAARRGEGHQPAPLPTLPIPAHLQTEPTPRRP
ncbi:flagellar type III secretion system protein FlhB [uncultured Ferrimonas sp.]|uniref:EscU/YscU/HrcU family type III secretion system export apparatus switch protein n=1 Tax=uncultured Ferrimonas sp. TaxID=432640 RepID=UPI0026024612|nr:flagellar type III secretion system protein FlhB [uncultured Ferrimonas sp.]